MCLLCVFIPEFLFRGRGKALLRMGKGGFSGNEANLRHSERLVSLSHILFDINEYASNPCTNGETCFDQINRFVCDCIIGFTGTRCETSRFEVAVRFPYLHHLFILILFLEYQFSFFLDINECASNPCLNEATCVDQVNGYVCNCKDGYLGDHCQTGKKTVQLMHIT